MDLEEATIKALEGKLDEIIFKDEEDLTDEEDYFLHGNCHQWCINNFKSGDEIIALVEYDEDIEKDALLHSFIKRNGQFCDVRGCTNNFDNILDIFDYGEFDDYVFKSVDAFKKFLEKMRIPYN